MHLRWPASEPTYYPGSIREPMEFSPVIAYINVVQLTELIFIAYVLCDLPHVCYSFAIPMLDDLKMLSSSRVRVNFFVFR